MGTFGAGSWWINEQPGHRNSPSGPGLDQRLGQEETEHSEKVSKKCDRAAESTTWCHEEHKGTPDSTHAISSETHSQLAVLMHSGY